MRKIDVLWIVLLIVFFIFKNLSKKRGWVPEKQPWDEAARRQKEINPFPAEVREGVEGMTSKNLFTEAQADISGHTIDQVEENTNLKTAKGDSGQEKEFCLDSLALMKGIIMSEILQAPRAKRPLRPWNRI